MAPLASRIQTAFTAAATTARVAAESAPTPAAAASAGPGVDPNTLVQTVLRGSHRQTADDLRFYDAKVKDSNAAKAEARGYVSDLRSQSDSLKDKLASVGETDASQSLKLQMLMDRMSKSKQSLSNIYQKLSATSSSIVSNMK